MSNNLIFRFPFKMDISAMASEIWMNDKAWEVNKTRQKSVFVQRNTQTIALIHVRSRMGVSAVDSDDLYETIMYPRFPVVTSAVNFFVREYGGVCGRIAIVKLPPAKRVLKHIDEGAYYRKRDRFHLVIQGSYEYTVGEETDIFSAGDLLWFDSQTPHHTKNIGNVDRIVVIFEVEGSKFREKLNVQ